MRSYFSCMKISIGISMRTYRTRSTIDSILNFTRRRSLKSNSDFKNGTFQLPDSFKFTNRVIVDGVEALCMTLKRVAYPCRYADIVPRFSRTVSQICMVTDLMIDFLYHRFGNLLRVIDQPMLSSRQLQIFANAVHNKGAALNNCWGFIDGTVRPICRPDQSQRAVYNGHKRVHANKFQSVVCPNGIIANLFCPVEGGRHDSAMLQMSGLLDQLEQHSHSPEGEPLCLYGDPAYPHRVHLQCPFPRRPDLTQDQLAFNESMSQFQLSRCLGILLIISNLLTLRRF